MAFKILSKIKILLKKKSRTKRIIPKDTLKQALTLKTLEHMTGPNSTYNLGYPIYGAKFLKENILLVAGGGGNEKSNINATPNKITALRIDFSKKKVIKRFREITLDSNDDSPTTLDAAQNVILMGCNEGPEKVQSSGANHHLRKYIYENEHLKFISAIDFEGSSDLSIYTKLTSISTDGSVGALTSSRIPSVIRVINPADLSENYEVQTGRDVKDLHFSPDGQFLTYITTQSLEVISIRTGKFILRKTDFPKNLNLSKVRFINDNTILVASSFNDKDGVALFKVSVKNSKANVTSQRQISTTVQNVTALEIDPKGNFLVLATNENAVAIIKINDFSVIENFKQVHNLAITRIAISPDSKLIASVSAGHTVNVISLNGSSGSGSILKTIKKILINFILIIILAVAANFGYKYNLHLKSYDFLKTKYIAMREKDDFTEIVDPNFQMNDQHLTESVQIRTTTDIIQDDIVSISTVTEQIDTVNSYANTDKSIELESSLTSETIELLTTSSVIPSIPSSPSSFSAVIETLSVSSPIISTIPKESEITIQEGLFERHTIEASRNAENVDFDTFSFSKIMEMPTLNEEELSILATDTEFGLLRATHTTESVVSSYAEQPTTSATTSSTLSTPLSSSSTSTVQPIQSAPSLTNSIEIFSAESITTSYSAIKDQSVLSPTVSDVSVDVVKSILEPSPSVVNVSNTVLKPVKTISKPELSVAETTITFKEIPYSALSKEVTSLILSVAPSSLEYSTYLASESSVIRSPIASSQTSLNSYVLPIIDSTTEEAKILSPLKSSTSSKSSLTQKQSTTAQEAVKRTVTIDGVVYEVVSTVEKDMNTYSTETISIDGGSRSTVISSDHPVPTSPKVEISKAATVSEHSTQTKVESATFTKTKVAPGSKYSESMTIQDTNSVHTKIVEELTSIELPTLDFYSVSPVLDTVTSVTSKNTVDIPSTSKLSTTLDSQPIPKSEVVTTTIPETILENTHSSNLLESSKTIKTGRSTSMTSSLLKMTEQSTSSTDVTSESTLEDSTETIKSIIKENLTTSTSIHHVVHTSIIIKEVTIEVPVQAKDTVNTLSIEETITKTDTATEKEVDTAVSTVIIKSDTRAEITTILAGSIEDETLEMDTLTDSSVSKLEAVIEKVTTDSNTSSVVSAASTSTSTITEEEYALEGEEASSLTTEIDEVKSETSLIEENTGTIASVPNVSKDDITKTNDLLTTSIPHDEL